MRLPFSNVTVNRTGLLLGGLIFTLVIMLAWGPVAIQTYLNNLIDIAVKNKEQIKNNTEISIETSRTANQTYAFIRSIMDEKISQHSIHVDAELGDVNGNLTKLINGLEKLGASINATATKNLNLTKFNRASLVDTNHNMREIATQLNITLPEFIDPTQPH